jgi:23S rRNA (guanosine2251-2'-O)-methyltransferase
MSELIYGINPVREALRGGRRKPLEVYVLPPPRAPRLEELLHHAAETGIPARPRDRAALDRMAGHPHHQGVILRIEPFPYADLDDLLAGWRSSGAKALFLLLDGITDPHNFGAVVRSAHAAGCQGVIIPKDRSCPVTAVVDKASAGALEHVLLCQVTNLARTIETLKVEGIWVYGLAAGEGTNSIYQADLRGDLALVVGSEGSGLRRNVRNHCDALLEIPMQGVVSSLNASVAAAVALFETVRQRAC